MTNDVDTVTMVKQGIHNPAEPRHFMRITCPEHEITAAVGDVALARSRQALKLKEVGYDIYDAVIYFPRDDVEMTRLQKTDKTTHCPLKGDTEYFDVLTDGDKIENVAWSYHRPFDYAVELKDYIGFDTRHVNIVEHSAG